MIVAGTWTSLFWRRCCLPPSCIICSHFCVMLRFLRMYAQPASLSKVKIQIWWLEYWRTVSAHPTNFWATFSIAFTAVDWGSTLTIGTRTCRNVNTTTVFSWQAGAKVHAVCIQSRTVRIANLKDLYGSSLDSPCNGACSEAICNRLRSPIMEMMTVAPSLYVHMFFTLMLCVYQVSQWYNSDVMFFTLIHNWPTGSYVLSISTGNDAEETYSGFFGNITAQVSQHSDFEIALYTCDKCNESPLISRLCGLFEKGALRSTIYILLQIMSNYSCSICWWLPTKRLPALYLGHLSSCRYISQAKQQCNSPGEPVKHGKDLNSKLVLASAKKLFLA